MEIQNISLDNLLSLEHLQLLQEKLAQITHIPSMLVDAWGVPLTRVPNPNGYCRLSDCKETCKHDCLAMLTEQNRSTGKLVLHNCPETGLTIGAVPIVWDDAYIGSWVTEHVRLAERPDGRDLPDTAEGPCTAPAVTRQELETVFAFFATLNRTIIHLGNINYAMNRTNRELTDLTEQLDLTIQMLKRFTNSADVGMFVTDFFTGEILQINEKCAQTLGSSPQDLTGTPCWASIDADRTDFCPDCPHAKLLDDKGQPAQPVILEKRFDTENDCQWLRFTHQAIYWVDGRLAHMVTFVDITHTKQMQNALEHLAYYDRMMGLPNALKLLQDTEDPESWKNASLICMDILALRTINDAYSREVGDALLHRICDWLRQATPSGSTLYRIDGDEFCIAVRDIGPAAARQLAGRIYSRFEEPWHVTHDGEKLRIFCGVSMGMIDNSLRGGNNIISLIERTLFSSRKDGSLAVYDESLDEQYQDRLRLELSLKQCVKNNMQNFRVYYQPIVDISTGTWCSFEALCRWTCPERGEVPPDIFIHVAEQLGLIGAVGRWVLDTAVEQCKRWGLDKLPNFLLHVNLSPTQFSDDALVDMVVEVLSKYDYPGEKLSMEITESTEFNFTNQTLNAIERLGNVNVLVALDDFGTGYSSFNNLKQLPVSLLKTEQAFIQGIENDQYLQYLFFVMVELAHTAHMKLIAEGVENLEQLELLVKNGADYVQGYFFSRPLPAHEIEKRLDNFQQSDQRLVALQRGGWVSGGTNRDGQLYTVSPDLYGVLLRCMQLLLSQADPVGAINEVLQIVGSKFNVSRAYVFLEDGEGRYSNTHEWCAPGVTAEKENLVRVAIPKLSPSWFPMLQKDGMILASDIQDLPEDISQHMKLQHIRAMAVIPLWEGDRITGFVGFDDCVRKRQWMLKELLMLHNLCGIMANVLEKKRLQQEVVIRSKITGDVLNHLDILICVSDIRTGAVLFANEKIKAETGCEDIEGKHCWEVLQGRSGRCEFCKLDGLLANADRRQSLCWDAYNERNERVYQLHSSLITWGAGITAHLEYAIDITDAKNYESRLEVFASTDIFTGTLNRNALIERLKGMSRDAYMSGQPFTLCFIDIDRLKYTNDTYGHVQGDDLILKATQALRRSVRRDDVIGRYGGDEFIVLLYGCNVQTAERKIEEALAHLHTLQPSEEIIYTFSYGVAENSELPYEDSEAYSSQLIEMADQRMLVNKRRNRSVVAKRKGE